MFHTNPAMTTKSAEENTKKIPNHIAIIPDGNRRWAESKGLPAIEGHRKGANALKDLLKHARDIGVHTITFWGFSTENWNRAKEEISYLMKLFENILDENREDTIKNEVRIVHLGRKDRIPSKLAKKIKNVEEKTKSFTKHVLNMAIDYGGHDEILRAVSRIIDDIEGLKIAKRELKKIIGKFNDKYPMYLLGKYLDTANQPYPYPDLVIRTSGEQRLSGLLPWQCVYAEFYFPKVHFPDFTPTELDKAIEEYSKRDRRFGGNTKK